MKLQPLMLFLLSLPLFSAEVARDWTDTKGRKVNGILVAKDGESAEILLKSGKRSKIPLPSLIQADQDYIAAADVHPDPEISVKTVNVDSNEARTKLDRRVVEMTTSKTHGRVYTATIHWLGPKGNTVAIYKSETQKVTKDGKIKFEVEYRGQNKKGVGADYKGYAVGLYDEDGVPVCKSASQKPFERFLEVSATTPYGEE